MTKSVKFKQVSRQNASRLKRPRGPCSCVRDGTKSQILVPSPGEILGLLKLLVHHTTFTILTDYEKTRSEN